MTVTEHVAYLKGLAEGLEIGSSNKEGKLLVGMLDALESLADAVVDMQQQNEELMAELDDVYEEVSALTEDFLAEDEEAEGVADDEDLYQVVCPTCGEIIYLDSEMLDEGSIACHACGEELEFDKSALDTDDNS